MVGTQRTYEPAHRKHARRRPGDAHGSRPGPSTGGGSRRRTLAAAAALLVCVCAAAGCKAGAGASGSPIHITTTTAPGTRHGAPDDGRHGGGAGHARPAPGAGTADRAAAPALPAVGTRSARVRELQARLRQSGLFRRRPTGFYGPVTAASVRAFQHRRGLPGTGRVDGRTWAALTAGTHRPGRGELYPPTALPLGTPDPRCMTGRALCLSKSSRTLAWMVDGKVRTAMDVRFGSQYQPTREGQFRVRFKSRHHVSTIYHTPMPYALFFSGGQAVHYSSDFAARGYRGASHGCVNVRDKRKIARLFREVRTGDKVVVHK